MSNNEKYFYIHYPNYKKKLSLNTHFVFFCLLHSSVGVSFIRLQQHQPIYFDSIFHCTSFPSGKSPDGSICHVHQDCSHVCRKKIQWESRKWSFNDVLHPIALYKFAPAHFHCNFPLFYCLESPCRYFQMPPRLSFLWHFILY